MTDQDADEVGRTDAETAPFVGIVPVGSLDERRLKVTLPDGQGGVVEGILTAEQARNITLGLRASAEQVDGKPFFDGGWSTAECLRYAAGELEELDEQYKMKTRSIENANYEGSRNAE